MIGYLTETTTCFIGEAISDINNKMISVKKSTIVADKYVHGFYFKSHAPLMVNRKENPCCKVFLNPTNYIIIEQLKQIFSASILDIILKR